MKEYRIFGGKLYSLLGIYDNKEIASNIAKVHRKNVSKAHVRVFTVRTKEKKCKYEVWTT